MTAVLKIEFLVLKPGSWNDRFLWQYHTNTTFNFAVAALLLLIFSSPSPVEVAPAGLCRVVASFFSAPGSGSPSPVEVAPAGLCRVVASFFSAPGSGTSSPALRLGLLSTRWLFLVLYNEDYISDVYALSLGLLNHFFTPGWLRFVWIFYSLTTFHCFFHDFLTLIVLTKDFWIFTTFRNWPQCFDEFFFRMFTCLSWFWLRLI